MKKKDGKPFEALKVTESEERSPDPFIDHQGAAVIASTSSNGWGDGQLIFGIPDGSLCIANRAYEASYVRIFDSSLQLLVHSAGDTLAAVGVRETRGGHCDRRYLVL